MIPGLRTGYYLCFFGMHVFSPSILDLLGKRFREFPDQRLGLSESLNELSRSSKYLAIERNDMRFDIGQDYGLFKAQLALSLTGMDRELILTELLKFFGDKERYNN
jgi:UTP--glucose-1-phosphate uridylyltransferase